MAEDYVPLTDEQVAEIHAYAHATNVLKHLPNAAAHIGAILADREHYKRRAEAAEWEAELAFEHGHGHGVVDQMGFGEDFAKACEVCMGTKP